MCNFYFWDMVLVMSFTEIGPDCWIWNANFQSLNILMILADCWNHLEIVQMFFMNIKKQIKFVEKKCICSWNLNLFLRRYEKLIKIKSKKVYFILYSYILCNNLYVIYRYWNIRFNLRRLISELGKCIIL